MVSYIRSSVKNSGREAFRTRPDGDLTRGRLSAYPGREVAMRLAGERVLVTGSTSGIGKQVAITCAREGAPVAVHGRDRARGQAVVDAIRAAGGSAEFFAADLRDEGACTTLVDAAAARLGGLTVLVNNAVAGTGGRSPVGRLDTAAWENLREKRR